MVLDLQSKLIFSCFFLGSFLDETINKAIYNQTIPFILAASVHEPRVWKENSNYFTQQSQRIILN